MHTRAQPPSAFITGQLPTLLSSGWGLAWSPPSTGAEGGNGSVSSPSQDEVTDLKGPGLTHLGGEIPLLTLVLGRNSKKSEEPPGALGRREER